MQAFRQSGGLGAVVMLSQDTAPPYNRPPLSKDYLRGESDVSALPLEQPEYYSDNGIEVRLSETVVELDTADRVVRTRSGAEIGYDRCILALGSTPSELPVSGGESAHTLRWLEQAVRLRDGAQVATTAVVIGSGFIGCEAAASLATRGIKVTMVSTEKLPQLARLGPDAAGLIAGWLRDAGIELLAESEVSEISAGRLVRLSDGTMYSADLILSAVGVVPHTEVARRAGLQMKDGRILVDESMRASAPGVFAAGDAALAFNVAAGRHLAVEHWGDADAMGTIAGTVAAGRSATWSATPGFWSEIGSNTLKYAAWGDGYDTATTVRHDNGGLTIWYSTDGVAVGVLTHDADDDYDRGSTLIADGAPPPK